MSTALPYEPKYHDWSSEIILATLPQATSTATSALAEKRQDYFFHDMCSEYDSIHLSEFLRSSDIELSDDFWHLCSYWLRDENNHYRGLRRIYSQLYGGTTGEIAELVEARRPDFAPISKLIGSEFHVLICVAFDEITSARAYAKDREAYAELGGEPFHTWVKYAGRDEAVHARNALELIRHRYSHRLDEIPDHVERICDYDLKGDRAYYGTFLFDHDTDDFSKELLIESARTLCSFFDKGPEFDTMLRQANF